MALLEDKPTGPDRFFRTTEFTIFPFVPFSEDWSMEFDNIGAGNVGDFRYGPSMNKQGGEGTGWAKRIADYNTANTNQKKGNEQKLVQDFANLPQNIRFESASMAKELADILQGDSPVFIRQKPGAPAPEVIDLVDSEFLQKGDFWEDVEGGWRHPLGPEVEVQSKKIIKGSGHEGIDLDAKTQADAERLEYILHRLANIFDDPSFVEGVMGIEVTHEENKKYLELMMEETDVSLTMRERFNKAGNLMAGDIVKEYHKIHEGLRMKDLVAGLSKQKYSKSGGKTGGRLGLVGESLPYITKQTLDRMAELYERANEGLNSYLYQVPLLKKVRYFTPFGERGAMNADRYELGIARFEPVWSADSKGRIVPFLVDIKVRTQYVNLLTFLQEQGWTDEKGAREIFDNHLTTTKQAKSHGLLNNLLVLDALKNVEDKAALLLVTQTNRDAVYAIHEFLNGQREELLGSSMLTQIDSIAQGMGVGSASVEAVQTLTTKDVIRDLKKQFEGAFLKNTKLTQSLKTMFNNASTRTNRVTQAWKKKVGAKNSTVKDGSIWANENLYTTPGEKGTGVGTPFAFFAGEDPQAFNRFKMRASDKLLYARYRPQVEVYEHFGAGRAAFTGGEGYRWGEHFGGWRAAGFGRSTGDIKGNDPKGWRKALPIDEIIYTK